jgi:hypothetical protein
MCRQGLASATEVWSASVPGSVQFQFILDYAQRVMSARDLRTSRWIFERVDETFENGAVPKFLITPEAAPSGVKPDEQQKAMREHFYWAIEMSHGKRTGT